MTEQPNVWRATGLYWHNRTPGLGLADPSGTERIEPVPPGTPVGYRLGAERYCVGVWLPLQRRRQPCPFTHPILPVATRAQCDPCAATDPGQMLARNITVDDGREYMLYLAWFGSGLTKVGLTATERGTDRLAEQGALAFTWLAHGNLPIVRAVEQRISASGLAPERRQRRAKLATWWKLPEETQRRDELRTAYQQIVETVPWPADLVREPCTVVDQVELFGLGALPDSCQEITALSSGAVLSGTVRCVAGRDLLLDAPDRTLLVDTRLLGGWPMHLTTEATTGLELRACEYARSDHAADQTVLF
ncbi:MAG TPA: DUF2797 domain-containing protein [Pseudonocardiaceae bacterium]|nr:DUF2797 domain-containing protein [Pseudonocardiaceae bacterium]